MIRLLVTLPLLLALAACEHRPRDAGPAAFRIAVDDAWVRPVAGADTARLNSAAYFTLTNHSTDSLALLEVRTNVAARSEVHETLIDDGVIRMRPIERVDVGPGQSVPFLPGGLHVMLVDLQRDLLAGDSLSITFRFDDGTEEVAPFKVRPAAL